MGGFTPCWQAEVSRFLAQISDFCSGTCFYYDTMNWVKVKVRRRCPLQNESGAPGGGQPIGKWEFGEAKEISFIKMCRKCVQKSRRIPVRSFHTAGSPTREERHRQGGRSFGSSWCNSKKVGVFSVLVNWQDSTLHPSLRVSYRPPHNLTGLRPPPWPEGQLQTTLQQTVFLCACAGHSSWPRSRLQNNPTDTELD